MFGATLFLAAPKTEGAGIVQVSMWDIFEALDYEDAFPLIEEGLPNISFARLISSSHISDEAVYVCRAKDFFETSIDDVIIVHRNDMIIVNGVSTEEVFDEVCDVIDRFNDWERTIEGMIGDENGMQEMVDASKDVLEAPVFAYAPDGRAFAISSSYGPDLHWHWAEILENRGMTSAGIKRLRDQINLPEVWRDTYPKTRASVMGSHGYMHCSLKPNGFMAGHCVLFGFDKPFKRGLERIVSILVKAMERHMERFYWMYSPTSQVTDAFVLFLSTGEFDEPEISLYLRALQWDFKDTFRVYVVHERGAGEPVLLSRLLNDVQHRFPYTISFALDNGLVVLENESRSVVRDSIATQLPSLLGNDFACGVSVAREDIRQCRLLYLQARYEVRRCAEEGVALSYAEEHAADYFADALRGDELIATYAHPEIVRLQRFDNEHETHFYETLRAYVLSSFHLSDAARHLNLHRNSLDYRLRRIREIIDFSDLDALASKPDADKLTELILSFAVIDAQNGI